MSGLLCLAGSLPAVQANDSGSRASALKSHGITYAMSYTGKSVMVDTRDLYYLADEIDTLESLYEQRCIEEHNAGYAEGLADGMDSAKLQINYHVHTGSPNAVGGCYDYGPMRETVMITCTENGWDDGSEQWNFWAYCSKCDRDIWVGCSDDDCWACWYKQYPHTHLTEGIHLTCGKTTETPESATIVF